MRNARRRVIPRSCLGGGLDDFEPAPREGRIKGARKTVVDGRRFDSKAEAERYIELRDLQRSGLIRGLKCQPRFILQPGFRYRGKAVAAVSYRADFEYRDQDGRRIIEDVKGFETEAFRIRWRMMQHRYQHADDVELRLVFVGNPKKRKGRKR